MSRSSSTGDDERPLGTRHYLERFARAAQHRAGPGWLETLRGEAIASFAEIGFPTRRLEEWRYTSTAPIERVAFELPESDRSAPTPEELAEIAPCASQAWRAVFVDGRLCAERSVLPADSGGLRIDSLADALAGGEGEALVAAHLARQAPFKNDAFTALNTAFMEDGALVEIPPGWQEERPLYLLFVSTGNETISHPRTLVIARPGSRATLIQDHVSLDSGTRFSNAVCEVLAEENAALDLVLIQRENAQSYHVSNLQAVQERDSRVALHTITLGGALVRNELGLMLAAPGAEADLRGLFLGGSRRHIDNHTLVDHAVPHCTSRQLYKGILGGHARGVFRGRVIVRPDAQKSDALQSNPNLLLANQAEINTKPQLEIRADDVKCSHGSTIGQLDREALFYLRSRGVEERAARMLLTRGFAAEIAAGLPLESLSGWARQLVDSAVETLTADMEGSET